MRLYKTVAMASESEATTFSFTAPPGKYGAFATSGDDSHMAYLTDDYSYLMDEVSISEVPITQYAA